MVDADAEVEVETVRRMDPPVAKSQSPQRILRPCHNINKVIFFPGSYDRGNLNSTWLNLTFIFILDKATPSLFLVPLQQKR